VQSDRELLEAAARAAGMVLDCTIRPDGLPFYHSERNALALADGGWFAPLTDDADAFRLAVALRLVVDVGSMAAHVFHEGPGEVEAHGTDPYAATRRAIVRAAAAMAKEQA
jgi:hypothetical protein